MGNNAGLGHAYLFHHSQNRLKAEGIVTNSILSLDFVEIRKDLSKQANEFVGDEVSADLVHVCDLLIAETNQENLIYSLTRSHTWLTLRLFDYELGFTCNNYS